MSDINLTGDEVEFMIEIVRRYVDIERKRIRRQLSADIRTALAKHEEWTSGPDALEHLAKELEK